MKWPLVLRSTHERALASARELASAYRVDADRRLDVMKAFSELVAAERAHYDVLLEKYTMLRCQGFDLPVAPPVGTVIRTFDVVESAIREKAGGNPALIRMMRDQAASDRRAGVPDNELLRRIRSGVQGDSEAFALDTALSDLVGGPNAGVSE